METILSQTKTVHSFSCKRTWGRKDMTCARCVELANGAAPRAGWGDAKRKADAQRSQAIHNHFNVRGADGLTGHQRNEKNHTVDTAFEW